MYKSRNDRRQRGITTVWAVFMFMMLMAFVVLAIEVCWVSMTARQASATADASALAGALWVRTDQGLARTKALEFAAANRVAGDPTLLDRNDANDPAGDVVVGFVDIADYSFTPTTDSPNAVMVRARRTEASLSGPLQTLVGSIFGFNTAEVAREAVAMTVSAPTGMGLIMLQPNGPDAIQHSGNGPINVLGPVIVNSNGSQALHHSGNGDFSATSFEITGNYKSSGNGDLIGPITTGVPPTPDPLAGMPVPNWRDYPRRSREPFKVDSPGTTVLQPGYYNGGIDISTNGTVILNPGIYIMRGKGFKVSGNLDLIANNVMLYNGSGKDDADQFYISSDANVTWTPPTSGPWAGVAIFQQRNVSDKKVQISGNGNTNIEGIVYAKTAEVQLSGNGGTNFIGSAFVANSMQISGDGTLNIGVSDDATPGLDKVFLVK